MYFPTTCVDNFFNAPDEVRNFALSLEYEYPKNGSFPGKRTKLLSEIYPNYFHLFCEKLFSLFFNLEPNKFAWNVSTYFQVIEPNEYRNNCGWIHLDDVGIFAGIIYLTPNISLDCGTSIFKPKKLGNKSINHEEKHGMFLSYNKNKIDYYQSKIDENNEQFEETVNFKNVYNRLISYDASQYHAVNNLCDENVERLTQVFFVHNVFSNYFPIPSSKKIQL